MRIAITLLTLAISSLNYANSAPSDVLNAEASDPVKMKWMVAFRHQKIS